MFQLQGKYISDLNTKGKFLAASQQVGIWGKQLIICGKPVINWANSTRLNYFPIFFVSARQENIEGRKEVIGMEFNGLNMEGREERLIGLLGKLFLVVINCPDVEWHVNWFVLL